MRRSPSRSLLALVPLALVGLAACGSDDATSGRPTVVATTAILGAHPGVRVIMGICSPAPPGAAEAVKQSGRSDVKVLGLSLPNMNKRFVHDGVTDCIILWKTADLGYLTVLAADALIKGTLRPGADAIEAGRLGRLGIAGDNILLGTPFLFTKDNIDQFDF